MDTGEGVTRLLDHRLYGLAAEIRAVEEGHNARVLLSGTVRPRPTAAAA